MKYYYTEMQSPVGDLTIVSDNENLCAIYWKGQEPDKKKFPQLEKNDGDRILKKTVKQLTRYFTGRRVEFDMPLRLEGTDFQKQVWSLLPSVKYGQTASYGDIAKMINRPRAVRAVGSAISKNPISIIIPCHRVIGSNGQLTGFAGGLDTKEYLLNLENQA